jgi:uncharacterized protein YjbI with pentapeptide repeats
MQFILINKNKLIPKIINLIHDPNDTENIKIINKLLVKTFNKNISYCKNIYVVCLNETHCVEFIYFSNGKNAFKYKDNKIIISNVKPCIYHQSKIKNFLLQYNNVKDNLFSLVINNNNNNNIIIDNELNETELNETELNETELNETELNEKELNETELNKIELNETELNKIELNETELNKIELNETELNEIKLKEELNKTKLNEIELNKIKLKEELKNKINDIITLYNNEKENIKKYNNHLKRLEKDELNIQKKIRTIKIDKLSVLFYDYKTYKKINEKINKENSKENDDNIPILFIKKYKYLESFEIEYKKLCDILININFNKLVNSTNESMIEITEEILNELFSIAEIYNKKIKLLNVEFNHSWEELDADIDGYKT